MTYQQTLDWLFAQLPMYQRVGGANYKIDLEKTHALMALLGYPEKKLTTIHVAGTNGKGSVSHMMASVLQSQGFKVGLYTSPHLIDFRERVKINGQMIREAAVIDFVDEHKKAFADLELSFFEMTVGLAFAHFVAEKVDIAVIEVGMGGRLDSTNVITPLVSVITNIGFDHMAFLGDTLEKIAGEKAGIIKPNVPVVVGKTQAETEGIFRKRATDLHAPLVFADQKPRVDISCDLSGIYQAENVQTAYTALQQLPENFRPNPTSLANGFAHVVANTGLMGRWQVLEEKPLTIADTAHNEDGIKLVMKQLRKLPKNQLHIIWGMVNDKEIGKILPLLPKTAHYYFCQPSIPRALPVETLDAKASDFGLKGTPYHTVAEAYQAARNIAALEDVIFIGGSTFVVADVLANLNKINF